MTRYIIIGAVVFVVFWLFNSKSKLPRNPARIDEDFRLAKNKWATGTWSQMDAAKFLSRLHSDALDGAKRAKEESRRREHKALANEILAWTADNIR